MAKSVQSLCHVLNNITFLLSFQKRKISNQKKNFLNKYFTSTSTVLSFYDLFFAILLFFVLLLKIWYMSVMVIVLSGLLHGCVKNSKHKYFSFFPSLLFNKAISIMMIFLTLYSFFQRTTYNVLENWRMLLLFVYPYHKHIRQYRNIQSVDLKP